MKIMKKSHLKNIIKEVISEQKLIKEVDNKTITNKIKKSQLKKIIKEVIKEVIKEDKRGQK